MTTPVQISFRNMTVSPELEEEVRSRAAWLDSFHPRIVGCRVVLEAPHRHRHRPLRIRVELSLPGEDVVVEHEPTLDTTARSARMTSDRDGHHKDAHVTIREAFDMVRRRLEDVVRRKRENVKTRADVA
jgi:ribosome-associated translation inhibitor RaiA